MLKKLPKRDKNGQISLMALCQIIDEKRPWWWWWLLPFKFLGLPAFWLLMHPSKETLNSPSSRVDADSTSRRRRILRCILSGLVNLDLINFLTMWIFTLCEFRPGESWTNAVYISSENVSNTKIDCSKNVLIIVVLVEYKLKWMCC